MSTTQYLHLFLEQLPSYLTLPTTTWWVIFSTAPTTKALTLLWLLWLLSFTPPPTTYTYVFLTYRHQYIQCRHTFASSNSFPNFESRNKHQK